MKIVFTGGGTGGHIFPIVAVVKEIRKAYPSPELKIYYLGPEDPHGAVLLKEQEVKIKGILSGKLRRYFSFKNFSDIFFKIPIGFIQSFFWLFMLAPDVVFSKGGYGSFPVVIAAKALRIPLILHESDIVPGLVSKITGKFALEIFSSFPNTERFAQNKTTCVGNPIRTELLEGNKEKAKEIFKLQGGRPLVLFIGGSQGAQSINNLVLEILSELLKEFEVVHQTGLENQKQVMTEAKFLANKELMQYYHSFPFLNETQLKHILAAVDLVVSRAGAGAIFEIAAAKKPAILIPLPGSAQNHQLKNAYCFAENGGGEVMEEQNLKPHLFLQKLQSLFLRQDVLEVMSENSGNFARPQSAKVIANYLIEYLS